MLKIYIKTISTLLILIHFTNAENAYSQNVGVAESPFVPDAAAILEIQSTTQGLLIPRLSSTERDALLNPAHSLLIFNLSSNCMEWWNNLSEEWVRMDCGSPKCGNQIFHTLNVDVGTMILGSDDQDDDMQIEKYCYNDQPANCATYGGLYQWAEAMDLPFSNNIINVGGAWQSCDPCGATGIQGLCPAGYHIPTDLEWSRYEWCTETTVSPLGTTPLSTYQNNTSWRGSAGVDGAGYKMKAFPPYWDGNNSSGFGAIASGMRSLIGTFSSFGTNGYYWSSTEVTSVSAYARVFQSGENRVSRLNTGKNSGNSIRCIRN